MTLRTMWRKFAREAGVPATLPTFVHYLNNGVRKGRRSLADLTLREHEGCVPYDAAKPTCLIGVSDLSAPTARHVSLNMVRAAAKSQNVVVVALAGGACLDRFREHACVVIISDRFAAEMALFQHPALSSVTYAVLTAVECAGWAGLLAERGIATAIYITEYAHDVSCAALVCEQQLDLLAFSSAHLRSSWKATFADHGGKLGDALIIPHTTLVNGGLSEADYHDARADVALAIGRECSGKRLIMGAGDIGWRKGTDLFIMAAQIAAANDPDCVFVWVGDGPNHEDVYSGAWHHKHMEEAGANASDGPLFVIPEGAAYDAMLNAADTLFLSSRSESSPIEVFDAARHGCEVVIFQGATEFAGLALPEGAHLHSVPYGDVVAAAERLLALPLKTPSAVPTVEQPEQQMLFDQLSAALRGQT